MNVNKAVSRFFLGATVCLVLLLGIASFYLLRQPASASFSKELTLQEQKVIADTVRRHSVANLLIAAQSLRFDFAFERLRDLPESVVYAQEKRSDGRIRVYVGVPDQSATGGYRPYARYLLERREDGWSIVNDF